ncbi:hypothetical protein L195_g061038, partial [Trifolium pratense]
VGVSTVLLLLRRCFDAPAVFKNVFLSVKTLWMLSFPSFLRQPRNQIANVNFLLIPEAFGGLHRARCFGGLQFAQICVECV